MELIKLTFWIICLWGAFLAAPTFGFIVGSALAVWFLFHLYKEHKHEQNDQS